METYKVRIKGKTLNLEALTAKEAARKAFELEAPSGRKDDVCEILNKQKQRMTTFTRKECGILTLRTTMSGTQVSFGDDYQRITLHCDSGEHAVAIAKALEAGALRFSSKAE